MGPHPLQLTQHLSGRGLLPGVVVQTLSDQLHQRVPLSPQLLGELLHLLRATLHLCQSNDHPWIVRVWAGWFREVGEGLDNSEEGEVAKGEHIDGSIVLRIPGQSFRRHVCQRPLGLEDKSE